MKFTVELTNAKTVKDLEGYFVLTSPGRLSPSKSFEFSFDPLRNSAYSWTVRRKDVACYITKRLDGVSFINLYLCLVSWSQDGLGARISAIRRFGEDNHILN